MSQPDEYSGQAGRLWEMTGADWFISLSVTITEPVCAFVDVSSDDESLPRLEGFIGTADANESIGKACDYMLKNLETFYAENPDKRPQR